jgi:hypothetical protein
MHIVILSLSLSLSLSHTTVGTVTHGVAGDPTLPGSYPVHKLFFRFGGGHPLHKVHFLIFRNPLGVTTTCSMILSLELPQLLQLAVYNYVVCPK